MDGFATSLLPSPTQTSARMTFLEGSSITHSSAYRRKLELLRIAFKVDDSSLTFQPHLSLLLSLRHQTPPVSENTGPLEKVLLMELLKHQKHLQTTVLILLQILQ